jgi:hypothetical protein
MFREIRKSDSLDRILFRTPEGDFLFGETRLFRNLGVGLRNPLCGVALFMPIGYYASAEFLDRLDLAKNPRFPAKEMT